MRHALVVDDRRSFSAAELGVQTLTHVRSSQAAIAALDDDTLTDLFLDYDLAWNNALRHDTAKRVVDHLCQHAARFAPHLAIEIITDLDTIAAIMATQLREARFSVTVSDRGHRWNDEHL